MAPTRFPARRPALWICAAALAAAAAPAGDGASPTGPVRVKPDAGLRGMDWSAAWSVAFSPDGKTLAVGAGNLGDNPGRLKVWDLATRRERAQYKEAATVRSVAFSPDGKTLATGEVDSTVKLRDPETGAVRQTLQNGSPVNGIAFSPDGALLAAARWDGAVGLWDLGKGEERAVLRGHTSGAFSVAFSPDGKTLASASGDKTAKLWDVATGKERATLAGHTEGVETVAFSLPDSGEVATASWDRTVKVWDAATGKELFTLKGHTEQALCVAFSPDGKTLASGSGRWMDYDYTPGPGEVILWDLTRRTPLQTFRGHPDRVFGIAFDPDGKTLASACCDGTVRLWEVDRKAP